jgi:YHS domain-containing protein
VDATISESREALESRREVRHLHLAERLQGKRGALSFNVCKETAMAKDPVCGMEVKPDNAAAKTEHGGKTYLFCSTACKDKFDENPNKFIESKAHVAN